MYKRQSAIIVSGVGLQDDNTVGIFGGVLSYGFFARNNLNFITRHTIGEGGQPLRIIGIRPEVSLANVRVAVGTSGTDYVDIPVRILDTKPDWWNGEPPITLDTVSNQIFEFFGRPRQYLPTGFKIVRDRGFALGGQGESEEWYGGGNFYNINPYHYAPLTAPVKMISVFARNLINNISQGLVRGESTDIAVPSARLLERGNYQNINSWHFTSVIPTESPIVSTTLELSYPGAMVAIRSDLTPTFAANFTLADGTELSALNASEWTTGTKPSELDNYTVYLLQEAGGLTTTISRVPSDVEYVMSFSMEVDGVQETYRIAYQNTAP